MIPNPALDAIHESESSAFSPCSVAAEKPSSALSASAKWIAATTSMTAAVTRLPPMRTTSQIGRRAAPAGHMLVAGVTANTTRNGTAAAMNERADDVPRLVVGVVGHHLLTRRRRARRAPIEQD